ncbi:unnamed protein product (macronuclear) [Paramecium tetraurelia]|uniref:Uncharacterized protein n=1 Tax=Paramecium tetraurelia TaxID=5888 RepID=A0D066_PARTE|nr:uncharacterized protein GSPATT00011985001 [Paramecium tetraurelia]CAK76433.1 unnamed protein product [Paramecium tetraurelia]|eukprot:XP_001443830.1 hypothetical protein (macronuclear) [Paramecium tetraurelia strain d4-2]
MFSLKRHRILIIKQIQYQAKIMYLQSILYLFDQMGKRNQISQSPHFQLQQRIVENIQFIVFLITQRNQVYTQRRRKETMSQLEREEHGEIFNFDFDFKQREIYRAAQMRIELRSCSIANLIQ